MRDAKPGVKGKHAAKWWTNDESVSTESKIEIDQSRTMHQENGNFLNVLLCP
jgi:hypothetical protein